MLLRITAPHFVAGVVLLNDRVSTCAPILRYMYGWDEVKIRRYCSKKHWNVEICYAHGVSVKAEL
jgi:hypothetical protein